MGILFIQWYTGAMLLLDAYVVYSLWGTSLLDGTATLTGTAAPHLSQRSMWFDKNADSPTSTVVFTFVMVFLMLPRLFAILQPVNRWILLNAAVLELTRLVLFSLLFSINEAATSANTMALTFMAWNVIYYTRAWYTTMCALFAAMKG